MNLEAVLRIAAQVTGESNVRALGDSIRGIGAAAENAKKSFTDVVNSAAFQAAAVAAAAVGTALVLSTREAISFESAMADVRKVVDGLDTPAGMKAIRQEIFELSRQIPITAQGFAEMYAAAARAGVPREELRAFAEGVAKVAVAFDMTAGEAGEALAKIRTNLGLSQDQLMLLADAMNELTNTIGGSTSELVEFVLRAGSAGKQAGLSAEETAAFGAAMIASGAASEVAATSFNNMLKALSRGDSMTDRQIGALVKLGYASGDAAQAEARLTQAVEAESAKRMRAIETESRAAVQEINRRYREIQTIQQDSWDREDLAYSRGQEDRYETLAKRLQRERQAEIDASNKRAEALGYDNKLEIQAIEDRYDERAKTLRRAQEDERIAHEKDTRDQRQVLKDNLDDQRQMELDAAEQKFKELKRIEDLRKKEAIANAKETAKAMVGELGPKMAKMLQEDAVGTIRDVFSRIKALPAELQMSVISDLFGDEAKALLPLINNSALLDKALGVVASQSNFAGSAQKEFASRIQTTEAKMQLAENRLNELAIVLGESFLPAITEVLKIFAPLIEGFTGLIQNVPGLGPAIGIVASAFIALVALAPFVASFVTIAQGIGTLGLGTMIAGWATGIGAAATGIGAALVKIGSAFASFLGANLGQAFAAIWGTAKFAIMDFLKSGFARQIAFTLGQIAGTVVRFFATSLIPALGQALSAVAAFLSGPVGWALLIAGLIAALVYFREPIMKFFAWVGESISGWVASLWQWAEPIRTFWGELWTSITELATPFFEWIAGVWNTYLVEPISVAVTAVGKWFAELWTQIATAATAFFEWFGSVLYGWFVEPWIVIGGLLLEATVAIWEQIREPVNAFFSWFGEFLYAWFVEPWVQIGTFLVEAAVATWTSVRDAVAGFLEWFVEGVRTYLVDPFVSALTAVGDFFVSAFTVIRDFVVGWFEWWSGILYQSLVEPWVKANEWIPKAAAIVWTAVQEIVSSFFNWMVAGARTYLLDPIVSALQSVGEWFSDVFSSISDVVGSFFAFWIGVIQDRLVAPAVAGLARLGVLFADAFKAIGDGLRSWFDWWAGFVNKAFVEPIRDALANVSELFGKAWTNVVGVVSKAFDSIRSAWQSLSEAMARIWGSLIDGVQRAWAGVAQAFVNGVVKPIQDAWQELSRRLGELFAAGVSAVSGAMTGIATAFGNVVVKPVRDAWTNLVNSLGETMRGVTSSISSVWTSIQDALSGAFRSIGKAFTDYVATPIKSAWEGISKAMTSGLVAAVETVKRAYETIAGAIVGAFRGIVGSVGRVINSIIGALNQLINGINAVRAAVGLSTFKLIPLVSIPTFADGGFVQQATLAVVGEGGEPEYIVPASKMAAAAQNYLDGVRGERVLDSRPRLDVAGGPTLRAAVAPSVAAPRISFGGGSTSVSVTTGPVQQVGGERYVTLEDLRNAVSSAAKQTREAVMRDLSQPGVRHRLGIA